MMHVYNFINSGLTLSTHARINTRKTNKYYKILTDYKTQNGCFIMFRIQLTLETTLSYSRGLGIPIGEQEILQLLTPINTHLCCWDVRQTIGLPAISSSCEQHEVIIIPSLKNIIFVKSTQLTLHSSISNADEAHKPLWIVILMSAQLSIWVSLISMRCNAPSEMHQVSSKIKL